MNRYLRVSILCFIFSGIMLWLFLTMGCAGVEIMGVCRHEATYAISVMGEKYPVRVAGGYRQGFLHAQAQAWIDGEWRWLTVNNGVVSVAAADNTFSPKQFYVPWVWFIQMTQGMVKENRP